MYIIFFLSSFCQLPSPQFRVRAGGVRPDNESSERLERVRIGKCPNAFSSKLESVRIGKCQNWKVSKLESVRIGKCQNWKVSDFFGVSRFLINEPNNA